MNHFKDLLISKRKALGLTSKELSKQSSVSESLLSGLQSGNRRIGEKQASRIASALGLKKQEKSDFIFMAMNESTQRLLESSKSYPVEVLNSLPGLLRNKGVLPENINSARIYDTFLEISLESGDVVRVYVNLSLN
jgi:transcriptional regulator with XRE-family HTH domain